MKIDKCKDHILAAIFIFLSAILFGVGIFYTTKWVREIYLGELPNHVWVYWENAPGNTEPPAVISLAMQTIIKHNKRSFHVHFLNEKNVFTYLPDLRRDLDTKLTIPQKSDYIRYRLLYKYGGIWLDADTIVFKDLLPLLYKLRWYDYVGFGFHSYANPLIHTGYPFPTTWVMIARKHSPLMHKLMLVTNEEINKHDAKYFQLKQNYLALANAVLMPAVNELLEKTSWRYYHMSSICVEMNSEGKRLNNRIMIMDKPMDLSCVYTRFLMPFYQTATGFPEWFKQLNQQQILTGNMLISRLFRFSLLHKV